mgnify:CR=1 FL=1
MSGIFLIVISSTACATQLLAKRKAEVMVARAYEQQEVGTVLFTNDAVDEVCQRVSSIT